MTPHPPRDRVSGPRLVPPCAAAVLANTGPSATRLATGSHPATGPSTTGTLAARRILVSLAVAVLLVAVAACAPSSQEAAAAFEPPSVAGWSGEPQVGGRLDLLRRQALAEPGSAAAIGRLGMAFHAHELHAEAIRCYRRATELAPDDFRWPYLAALATAETDLEASLDLFSRAAALRPDDAAVFVNYGDVLLRLGRGEEAAAEYRRALEIAPDTGHALYGLAQVAVAGGELDEAAELLGRAIALAPRHAEAHGLLAQVHRRLGRDEEAEVELLRAGAFPTTRVDDPVVAAMEAEAVSSKAFGERGRRLADAGRYPEAEAAFRRVLALRQATARDHSNLGGALAGQGKLEEAVAELERAYALDPEETYTLNNLALALLRQGRLDRAAELLERAVELDPSYAEAHHNLGLVRAQQGRRDAAVEQYRAALAADPSRVDAYDDLGSALAAAGDLDGAVDAWRAALEIDGQDLAALHNLSLALVQRGDHGEAIGWLRKGTKLAPNSSRLALLLAWELATAPETAEGPALRDPAEAEALARRVVAAYPDQAQAADVLAAALAAQGRFDLAVPLAQRALSLAQRNGPPGFAAEVTARLILYRTGRPYLQGVGRSP